VTDTTTSREVDFVRSFLNTIEYEDGVEQLDTPRALADWLVSQGLLASRPRAVDADLALAHRLRDALRAAIDSAAGRGRSAAAEHELDTVFAQLPLQATARAPGLAGHGTGVRRALGDVVAAVAATRIDGSWERLKVCPADDCRWVFYDTSRNRSRRWCSMEVCGNRNKVRAFRERSRD
jgi:predicted RNA-binding Zn ribbon-like protein